MSAPTEKQIKKLFAEQQKTEELLYHIMLINEALVKRVFELEKAYHHHITHS